MAESPKAVGVTRRAEDATSTMRANRRWWDADADNYHAAHGTFLGVADFVWCPERLREADAHLLGEVTGKRVLEVGCGAAMCSRWLAAAGARPVAFDISAGMLRHARAGAAATKIEVPLVQELASLQPPFGDDLLLTPSEDLGQLLDRALFYGRHRKLLTLPNVSRDDQLLRRTVRLTAASGELATLKRLLAPPLVRLFGDAFEGLAAFLLSMNSPRWLLPLVSLRFA